MQPSLYDTQRQPQQHQTILPSSGTDQSQEQASDQQHGMALSGLSGGPSEHEIVFGNGIRSHSPFPSYMHLNMIQLMQQNQVQQQQLYHQHRQYHQHHQLYNQPFHQPHHTHGADSSQMATGQLKHPAQHGDGRPVIQAPFSPHLMVDGSTAEPDIHLGHVLEERQQSPIDRLHNVDSPQVRQEGTQLLTNQQHPPPPMLNMASGHIPPGLDSDFGGPNRVSGPGHFMHMGRMTPPSEFGHFPMHPVPGGPFQAPFQQQQFHQRQQMFLHQQMLHQQPQQHMQQVHSFQPIPQHPLHHHQGYTQSPLPASSQDVSHSHVPVPTDQRLHASSVEQQDQIKDIESQINKLLFKNDNTANGSSQLDLEAVSQKHLRPLSGVTVQEIEEAQFKDMQNQLRRISLNNPPETQSRMQTQLQPESIPSFPPVIAVDQIQANKGEHETSVGSESSSSFSSLAGVAPVGHRRSNFLETRFKNPSMSGPESSFEPSVEKVPFSVKDIDFYSDRKYDPYRPSAHAFDVITRDAKSLCHNLMPKPEEETRKLALLKRLSEIANEVFDEAEVLPFGSSGNGLALANADMDVCVFLNAKEGEEEVSPVEFVERIGDRLEKDSEFENILQLKRARVPIVKLNHINGIACDIGYQNDLAIWNTRLLRAYCRIDPRLRDIVVVVKTWAKRRKINNPYTGSLSSYAYVLLVIHLLQRRGVLPNLQSIVVGNGKVPYWDCQGFNRYFFEDIPNLSRYWQPTPEAMNQSVGELLYEFFKYFASEFRYATHVVSIRSGGLLTKEAKEWTKDHILPQQQQQQQLHQHQNQNQQHVQSSASTDTATLQAETQETDAIPSEQSDIHPATDFKPFVKNRYLFCIEDPFELDHNVGRPVDRYSLFTIRGEFMRAAKILSRSSDGAITRLCYEKEVPAHQERNRNSSIDHGGDQNRDRIQKDKPDGTSLNSNAGSATGSGIHANGRRGSSGSNDDGNSISDGRGRTIAFPTGEGSLHNIEQPKPRDKAQGRFFGANGHGGERQRIGRKDHHKRSTITGDPRAIPRA